MHKVFNVLKYIFILIPILIIIAIMIAGFKLFYVMNLSKHDISSTKSPDGLYTVNFQQVGDPSWPFGPTTVKVTVQGVENTANVNFKESFTANIFNDGANVDSDNCKVFWSKESVQIDLLGDEQSVDRHIIKLDNTK